MEYFQNSLKTANNLAFSEGSFMRGLLRLPPNKPANLRATVHSSYEFVRVLFSENRLRSLKNGLFRGLSYGGVYTRTIHESVKSWPA